MHEIFPSLLHWQLTKKTTQSKKTAERRRRSRRRRRQTPTQTQTEAKTRSEDQENGKGKTTQVRREKKTRKKTKKNTGIPHQKSTQVKFSAPQRDRGGGRPKNLHFLKDLIPYLCQKLYKP